LTKINGLSFHAKQYLKKTFSSKVITLLKKRNPDFQKDIWQYVTKKKHLL